MKIIFTLPVLLEFIIGAIIYLIISWVANEVVSGVAEDTVCKLSGIDSKIFCFFLTHPVAAFFSTVIAFIVIGMSFRYRFFKNH